jgi:hypothetical protein
VAAASSTTVTGSVDWVPQGAFNLPPVVSLDVTLAFAGSGGDGGVPASERLDGQNIDVRATCP